jgi:hypothetical protein
MTAWPEHPVIYEINTWVWLGELSRKYRKPLTLATIPDPEWDAVAAYGFDAVWFMGIWERSPAGIDISMKNKELLSDFKNALPDFEPQDNVGSPYCVRNYVVDAHLGGPPGLSIAREKLAQRGMRLILDFVPNHVAPDHPWAADHPDYFIRGNDADLKQAPDFYVPAGENVLALGRDPFFPAWPDVIQLNAFDPGLRRAAVKTVRQIADCCDGIRCDMAMLMMNQVFQKTWGRRAGARPETEYWVEVISGVRQTHPDFLFMAEAYWDLEWELQQQGFDYCYDKRLYDRLEKDTAESVRFHLCAEADFQRKMVRFIENHDEPRAVSAFSPQKARAAAVTMATIPGAKLFHEGQFEGRKIRLPVFLGRRPSEPMDFEFQGFYRTLLKAATLDGFQSGEWRICERTGWPDNASYQNLVAWCWRFAGDFALIVVNLSGSSAQGRVRLPWDEISGRSWQMTDLFTGELYERNGDEMCRQGLYIDLPPWGFHVLTRWQWKLAC